MNGWMALWTTWTRGLWRAVGGRDASRAEAWGPGVEIRKWRGRKKRWGQAS